MPDQDWVVYLTQINEQLASVFVDLSFIKVAPLKNQPMLVCCSVTVNKTRENGQPVREEFAGLEKLEDTLMAATESLATMPGRITAAGSRDFFFYCADSEVVEQKVREALTENHPDYRFEIDVNSDEGWEVYQNILFPSGEEMQVIQNGRVVDSLAKHGDLHHVPRPIAHWVYFRNEADAREFTAAAAEQGFEAKAAHPPESGRCGVVLERSDRVDEIDDVTLTLFRLAGEHNGDYDGWESIVVLKDKGLTDALPS